MAFCTRAFYFRFSNNGISHAADYLCFANNGISRSADNLCLPNNGIPHPADSLCFPNNGIPHAADYLCLPNNSISHAADYLCLPNNGIPRTADYLCLLNNGIPRTADHICLKIPPKCATYLTEGRAEKKESPAVRTVPNNRRNKLSTLPKPQAGDASAVRSSTERMLRPVLIYLWINLSVGSP